MMDGDCENEDSANNNQKDDVTDETNRSKRLFLNGIHLPVSTPLENTSDCDSLEQRRELFRKAIRELFGPLGEVEEVFVPDRTTKQYAFVRMATASQADLVCQKFTKSSEENPSHSPKPLFQDIRIAHSVLPRNKTSSKKTKRHLANLANHQRLAKSSNCIIQLHKSHLERLQDYLCDLSTFTNSGKNALISWNVLGSTSDKAVSFLYCRIVASNGTAKPGTESPAQLFARWVESIWYVRPILHRVWILDDFSTEIKDDEAMEVDEDNSFLIKASNVRELVKRIMALLAAEWKKSVARATKESNSSTQQMEPRIRIRLATYPNKLRSVLLNALELQWPQMAKTGTEDESDANSPPFPPNAIAFSPTQATHTLNVLQLVAPPEKFLAANHKSANEEKISKEKDCNEDPDLVSGLFGLYLQKTPESPNESLDPDQITDNQSSETASGRDSDGKSRPTLVNHWRHPSSSMSAFGQNLGFSSSAESEDEICRAYWKLQEATERYLQCRNDSRKSRRLPKASKTSSMAGIDVGASPGGWTQFLVEECFCETVYSIDPGKLHPHIMAMTQTTKNSAVENRADGGEPQKKKKRRIVQHLQTTFQKGLPEIASCRTNVESEVRGVSPVQWYVSDMCVKDVGLQVDALLKAAELGLVQPKHTFIVITLKCTVGHSKSTFDHLVQAQVNRIIDHLDEMEVLHLFANRRSERTIMGYWM